MSVEVTMRDTETGETMTMTLDPGQFVVCCAEPAHVVSDVAYATGKNQVWVKRNRDEPVSLYKHPRGTCTGCGREWAVTPQTGLIHGHDNPRKPGQTGWTGRCPGSRKPPAAPVADNPKET